MGRGARVLGRVQTKDGRPVEGTQLNLAQGFDFFSAKTAFTDATGAFVFTAVAAGKYQVSMGRFENGASGQRREANVPAGGRRGPRLPGAGRPHGHRERDRQGQRRGQAGREGRRQRGRRHGGDAGASTETAADGTFTLAGLRPGRVQVLVQTPDGLTDSETVTVADGGGAAAVKFEFGSAAIRATLVGADGKTLVTGAWVVVEKAEKHEGGSGWEGVKAQVNSDEHGVVVASGLDPATYRLRIVGSGYAAKVTDPFPVADGETRDLGTVRLAAGGGVTGKVTSSSGAPLEGIGVSVRNERGESVFLFNIASTGSNGRYGFQGIEFGTYRLRFEGKGFAPVEQDVAVTAQGAVADAVMVSVARSSRGSRTNAASRSPTPASCSSTGREAARAHPLDRQSVRGRRHPDEGLGHGHDPRPRPGALPRDRREGRRRRRRRPDRLHRRGRRPRRRDARPQAAP